MSDFSKVNLYGEELNVKDAVARESIAELIDIANGHSEAINGLGADVEELGTEIDTLNSNVPTVSYANETISFAKGV